MHCSDARFTRGGFTLTSCDNCVLGGAGQPTSSSGADKMLPLCDYDDQRAYRA